MNWMDDIMERAAMIDAVAAMHILSFTRINRCNRF